MGFEKCKFYVLVWADNSEPLPRNVRRVLVWSGVTWADNSEPLPQNVRSGFSPRGHVCSLGW